MATAMTTILIDSTFVSDRDCQAILYHGRSMRLLLKKFKVLSVSLFFEVLFRDKAQGRGIHAIAKSDRFGSVGEDVPDMRVGMFAANLRPGRKELSVFSLDYISGLQRLVKLGQPVPESNLSSEL